jgi:acetyltransferase
VAVLSELGPRDGLIVGHLCLEPADHGREEIALAVADAFQGRGIGRQLVRAAVDWARKQGTHELVATAFASNARILRLLRSIPGEPSVLAADGGLVETVIPLAA